MHLNQNYVNGSYTFYFVKITCWNHDSLFWRYQVVKGHHCELDQNINIDVRKKYLEILIVGLRQKIMLTSYFRGSLLETWWLSLV